MRFRKDLGDLTELKKSIQEIGLIHPIVIDSKGVLIVGERRLKACLELNIEPVYRVVDFDNPKKAEIDENVIRKDFTPSEIYEIGKFYTETTSNKPGPKDNSCVIHAGSQNPREVVSDITGVGTQTLSKINKIFNSDNDDLKQKVDDGKISVNKGYKLLQHKEKIEEQKKLIESGVISLPEGVFDIISIDPPWKYDREYDPNGSRVASPYPEMSFEDLSQIKLSADKDCILWLWSTHKFIWEAKELMKIWGFEYKGILVWNKVKMGVGSWLRMQCEFCLLGIKGNPIWNATNMRDIIEEPRTDHSSKPDSFYKMIDDNFISRNEYKADYFGRKERIGWKIK